MPDAQAGDNDTAQEPYRDDQGRKAELNGRIEKLKDEVVHRQQDESVEMAIPSRNIAFRGAVENEMMERTASATRPMTEYADLEFRWRLSMEIALCLKPTQ